MVNIERTKEFKQRTGEFYTPESWVNESHSFIKLNLDEKFNENYIVWDCAWGTGNLTKDLTFNNLWASTLLEEDFIGNDNNQEAIKFTFDFLNDGLDKLPPKLIDALKDKKKLFFLINPPYGTSNTAGSTSEHKSGTTKTLVSDLMLKEKIDGTKQLVTQFLYRICKIQEEFGLDVSIGLFSPVGFMTGTSFIKFREYFLNTMEFKTGFIMKASEFDDINSDWPLSFTIWSNGNTGIKNNFPCVIKDKQKNGEIFDIGKKLIYNLDNEVKASDWIREKLKGSKTFDCIQMKSGLKTKPGKGQGRMTKDSFGYLVTGGNNVYKSKTDVYLLSSAYNLGHGVSITNDNLEDVLSLFSARVISANKTDWYSERDEYIKPNITNPIYNEWINNCKVYSLFHNKSHQSSLTEFDLINNFFWISYDEMVKELTSRSLTDILSNTTNQSNRFYYDVFDRSNLSPQGKEVLKLANQIVFDTLDKRLGQDKNLSLMSWDAGWVQIKKMLSNLKWDMKPFNKAFQDLEESMYEQYKLLGFTK